MGITLLNSTLMNLGYISPYNDGNMNTKKLYIDLNSIIHTIGYEVSEDLNKLMYALIKKLDIDEIIEKLNYDIIESNYKSGNDFKKFILELNEKSFAKLMIRKFEKYFNDIVLSSISKDTVDEIFVAMDGVPNMSKIIEQRKRTANNVYFKKLLYQKFDKELDTNNNLEYLFDICKFRWFELVTLVKPGTEFMKTLDIYFSSAKFKSYIKGIFPNLQIIEYSGLNEYDEGEKKIINKIYNTVDKANENIIYTIFSPDSDMIILLTIIKNIISIKKDINLNKINILKHSGIRNNVENQYIFVDITQFEINIKNKINIFGILDLDINYKNYLIDIAYIIILFGNDYLSKIEGLQIRYNFDLVIEMYLKTIMDMNYVNLVDLSDINLLNINFLKKFVDNMKNIENEYIIENDYRLKYCNYDKLKKIFEAKNPDDLNKKIEIVKKSYKNLIEYVMKNKFFMKNDNYNVERIHQYYKEYEANNSLLVKVLGSIITYNDIKYYFNFMRNDGEKLNSITIFTMLIIAINSFQLRIPLNQNEYNKIIGCSMGNTKSKQEYFFRYPELRTMFKVQNRTPKEKYSEQGMTPYNLEIYKLENIYDEYYIKYIQSNKADEYDYTQNYYKKYFNINENDNEIKNILMYEYIKGMIWIAKYYIGDYVTDKYIEGNVSFWYYLFYKSPYFREINTYLKNITDNNYLKNMINNDLENLLVKPTTENYFTVIDHYVYLNEINNMSNLELDAHNCKYFNQCIVKNIYSNDIKKMENGKNILLTHKNKEYKIEILNKKINKLIKFFDVTKKLNNNTNSSLIASSESEDGLDDLINWTLKNKK
jgi:5'-3' exonuclease